MSLYYKIKEIEEKLFDDDWKEQLKENLSPCCKLLLENSIQSLRAHRLVGINVPSSFIYITIKLIEKISLESKSQDIILSVSDSVEDCNAIANLSNEYGFVVVEWFNDEENIESIVANLYDMVLEKIFNAHDNACTIYSITVLPEEYNYNKNSGIFNVEMLLKVIFSTKDKLSLAIDYYKRLMSNIDYAQKEMSKCNIQNQALMYASMKTHSILNKINKSNNFCGYLTFEIAKRLLDYIQYPVYATGKTVEYNNSINKRIHFHEFELIEQIKSTDKPYMNDIAKKIASEIQVEEGQYIELNYIVFRNDIIDVSSSIQDTITCEVSYLVTDLKDPDEFMKKREEERNTIGQTFFDCDWI